MAWLVYLWTTCVWTSGAVQSLQSLVSRYPDLGGNESLQCVCGDGQCQPAFWCRARGTGGFQFLLSHNTADRSTFGDGVDTGRYEGGVHVSGRVTYSLRIRRLEAGDAGLYFCILPPHFLGSPVTRLRPGEKPPSTTAPPITTTTTIRKRKRPPSCFCPGKAKTPVQGCSLPVFSSLVGVLLGLALLLLATLLYFSRLPKKCRHQFVKK